MWFLLPAGPAARRTRCPHGRYPQPACARRSIKARKKWDQLQRLVSLSYHEPLRVSSLRRSAQQHLTWHLYKEKNWWGESLFQDSHQEGETVIITGNRQILDLSWAPQQEKKKGKWMWCSAIARAQSPLQIPAEKCFFFFIKIKKVQCTLPE